ncbi:hypothetical protein N657DRAFT_654238 [Parathielavia appendiculata]|uniref:Zn(2)-C6 fungal-type domain-containing protein n=1 Tax=Parathielavia appendiculata TaxID=2587402 RepID=A0AAN6U3B8_9PEZI|nr:hypothetical protein N657DRAFT_654238 [Parathielavia appendiculata]
MERRGAATGRSSTYGQSCMQCYKTNCRCVSNPSGGGCKRCRRLGKDCQPSDAARRRNAQSAATPDARIAQLEAKIELLGSSSPTDMRLLLGQDGMSNSTARSIASPTNSTTTGNAGANSNIDTGRTPAAVALALPPAEAERSLRFFRSQMLPYFPFISLASTLTASQLRQDRPILFQAIITVTTLSTQRRLPRIDEFKRLVFSSAWMQAQSSMDLLLGVLTYITWSTDAFLGRADLLSRLMVLAISLVFDLRLFKPSRPDVQAIVACTQGFAENYQTGDETVQAFLERQRALLACFVLSSQHAQPISSHFGRIDPLRWTPQMEDALNVITANRSCPTDEVLAFQVRVQLITHRAAQVREQHEIDRSLSRAPPTATSSIPSLLYLNTLRAELQGLQDSLSTIEPHPQGNSISSSIGISPDLARLESIHRSAASIRSWLGVFCPPSSSSSSRYSVAPADCLGLPAHFWAQCIWCSAILKHLSTNPLAEPAGVECMRAVRNTVDLRMVLDRMREKMNLVSVEAAGVEVGDGVVGGNGGGNDLFSSMARLFGRARVWAEERWHTTSMGDSAVPVQGQGQEENGSGSGRNVPDVEDFSWMDLMDLENDKWFEDVLGWSPVES